MHTQCHTSCCNMQLIFKYDHFHDMSLLIYHNNHQYHCHDRYLFYNYYSSILFFSLVFLLRDDFALYYLVFFLFVCFFSVGLFGSCLLFCLLFFLLFYLFLCLLFCIFFQEFKTVSWMCRDNFTGRAFSICFILFRTNLICHPCYRQTILPWHWIKQIFNKVALCRYVEVLHSIY